MKKRTQAFLFKRRIISLSFALMASAPMRVLATEGLTYHGRILAPNGQPVVSPSVQFHIQIKSPGSENCLIFDETQTADLSTTAGVFVLTIGQGTRASASTDGGFTLDQIFANRGTLNLSSTSPAACTIGTSYTPGSADGRHLVISFNDGSGVGWEALPTQNLNFVPQSLDSLHVGGYSPQNFLHFDDSVKSANTSDLTITNFNDLLALINGTSNKYITTSSGNGASLPVLSSNPSTLTQGQVWLDSGSGNLKFYNGSAVQTLGTSGGSVTSVGTGTGLTGGPITASGTISIANTAVTAASYGSASSVPTYTVNAQGQLTAASNTAIAIDGSQITGGNISTSGTIAAASESLRSLSIYNAGNTYSATITVPSSLSANYNLTLPSTAGSSNQVLTTNGSGVLSWTSPSAGSLSGDVTGTQSATVVSQVGGSTAANVHTAEGLVNGSQAANLIFASPASGSGVPSFRSLAAADLPSLTSTYFAQGGNSFSAAANLGTADNNNLNLITNNTSRMTITSGGNIGIGTTAPDSRFHLNSNAASLIAPLSGTLIHLGGVDSTAAMVTIDSFGSSAPPSISGRRASGTGASPADPLSGQTLLSLTGSGYDSGAYVTQAAITLSAAENWSNTAQGSYIIFGTASTGTKNMYERMRIDPSGNIGIGTTMPVSKLQVGIAPTATANYPLFALGTGAFDGSTAGFFTGNAAGTVIGINSVSGYTGDLVNYQIGGVSKFKVDSSGNITSSGATVTSGNTTSTGNYTTSGNISTTGSGTITSAGGIIDSATTASTSSSTGALTVAGGAGVAGDIFAGASINATTTMAAGTSLTTPQIYGSSAASGNIKIDGTSNATVGNVLLASVGGKVGIGTTAPATPLQVTGSGNTVFSLSNTSASGYVATDLYNESGTKSAGFGWGNTSSGSPYANSFYFNTNSTNPILFMTNNVERLRMTGAGAIGIGTTAPAAPLSIYSTVGGANNVLLGPFGQNSLAAIGFGSSLSSSTYSLAGDGARTLVNAPSGPIEFRVANASSPDAMYVASSGSVGIGTTTPSVPLQVIGTIQGTAVQAVTSQIYTGVSVTNGTNTIADLKGYATGNDNGNLTLYNAGVAGTRIQSSGNSFVGGNLGVNNTNPGYPLDVVDNTGNNALVFSTFKSSASPTSGATILGRRAEGTSASPTAISAADEVLTGLYGAGYTSASAFSGSAAAMRMFSAEPYTSSANGSYLTLETTPIGSTSRSERMRILSSGNVGIGTTAPVSKLQVGIAPTATANYPLFALGTGAFDGSTAGFFTGNAAGTVIGINAVSGYTGDLVNYQIGGVSKFKVDSSGNITSSGTTSSSGNTTSTGNYTTSGNISTTGSGTITSAGGITDSATTASTSSSTGALTVAGGVGVAGDIFAGASINATTTMAAGTSLTTPQIYGSSAASGNIKIDGTSNATKGNVLLATAGGNVGIGTTAPGALFQVTGASGLATISVGNSDAGTSGGSLQFISAYANLANANKVASTITGAPNLSTGGSLVFSTSQQTTGTLTERLRIDALGNVGIGTTAPNSLLHTVDAAAKTAAYTGVLHAVTDTSSTASINKIGMDVESTGAWSGTGAINTGLVVNATGGATNYAATFSGGNVGIGITAPSKLFQVNVTGLTSSTEYLGEIVTESTSGNGVALGYFVNPGGTAIQEARVRSTGSAPLALGTTASLQSIYILNSGFVGMGTTAPSSLLHTMDTATKTATYTGVLHSVTNTSSTASINKIGMDVESTGAWSGTGAINTGLVVNATGGATNYAAIFSGGNVGIGTTAPTESLHIVGGNARLDATRGYIITGVGQMNANGSGGLRLTGGSVPITFETSNTERVRIDTAGNFGIGTTAPVSKLQVGSAPTATANYPLFALGTGAFDGSTAGFFTGNANGTVIGVNAATGYTGDLVNYEIGGVSKFKVDASGNITTAGATTTSGNTTSTGNYSTSGNISTTGSGTITSAGAIIDNATTASTSSSTGALTVAGGAGIAGDVFAGASINAATTMTAGTSLTVPQIYGSSAASGTLKIDATSSATPGNILIGTLGGNIGIGTTAPSTSLHVLNASTSAGLTAAAVFDRTLTSGTPANGIGTVIQFSAPNDSSISKTAADFGGILTSVTTGSETGAMIFRTLKSGTMNERMRLDYAGNVGIGNTAPGTTLEINSVQPTSAVQPYKNGFLISSNSSYGGGGIGIRTAGSPVPTLSMYHAQGTLTAPTAVNSGNSLLNISAFAYDSSSPASTGVPSITMNATEAWGTTAHGSSIQFSTVANTTTTSGVRMTIDNSGNVGVGTTAPASLLSVGGTGNLMAVGDGANTNAYINFDVNRAYIGYSGGTGAAVFQAIGNKNLQLAVNNSTFGSGVALTIDGSGTSTTGNVGIGTTAPSAPLTVSTANVSGNIATFVSTGSGGAGCSISWNGTSCSSDIRLKENVHPLNNALDDILKLQGVSFTWKKDAKHDKQIGFIAQEIEKVFPEVVKNDDAGFKQVNYANLVAAVASALKEFYHKWSDDSQVLHRDIASVQINKADKTEVEQLKKENAELKARLERLEKALLH